MVRNKYMAIRMTTRDGVKANLPDSIQIQILRELGCGVAIHSEEQGDFDVIHEGTTEEELDSAVAKILAKVVHCQRHLNSEAEKLTNKEEFKALKGRLCFDTEETYKLLRHAEFDFGAEEQTQGFVNRMKALVMELTFFLDANDGSKDAKSEHFRIRGKKTTPELPLPPLPVIPLDDYKDAKEKGASGLAEKIAQATGGTVSPDDDTLVISPEGERAKVVVCGTANDDDLSRLLKQAADKLTESSTETPVDPNSELGKAGWTTEYRDENGRTVGVSNEPVA